MLARTLRFQLFEEHRVMNKLGYIVQNTIRYYEEHIVASLKLLESWNPFISVF